MIRTVFGAVLSGLCCIAAAQAAPYQVGKLSFHEMSGTLAITTPFLHPHRAALLAGGGEWPPVLFDENGQVNIGNVILDSASGRVVSAGTQRAGTINLTHGLTARPDKTGFLLRRKGVHCHLTLAALGLPPAMSTLDYIKSRYLQIVPSDTDILVKTRQDLALPDGAGHEYAILNIDIAHCQVSGRHSLGDPDYLIELGWTKRGAWWISGSIEQTLLRSTNGLDWVAVPLQDAISSLISSYVVNDKEIWLAAIMPDASQPEKDAYELLYSSDAGKNWTGVRPGEPLMRSIPSYWLEGARRSGPTAALSGQASSSLK